VNEHNETELYELLKQVVEGAIRWAHNQGYVWLRDTFLPALEAAPNVLDDEEALIADCYYILGDIYDFNGAPHAAIQAYGKAIEHDSEIAAAYREMAKMYQDIGNYEKAVELIDIAVAMAPTEAYALSDQERIHDDFENPPEPLYIQGDPIWQCDELLAAQKPSEALALVASLTDVDGRRAQARCYGAAADRENYLRTWEALAKLNEPFELRWSDWFFMPVEIFESPEIWQILLNICHNIKPSVFITFDSLNKSDAYWKLTSQERDRLLIEANLYWASKDIEQLQALLEQYPEFEDVKEAIEEIREELDNS